VSEIKVEEYYKKEAKEIVDMLFDKRFLNDNLAREAMDGLEEFLGFIIQSKCQSAAKVAVLTAKMRDRKEGSP